MRYALGSLIFATILVPGVATALALDFGDPATVRGDLNVAAASWVAARLPEGTSLEVDIAQRGLLVLTNHTYPTRIETPVTFVETMLGQDEEFRRAMDATLMRLTAGPGGATLVMRSHGTLMGAGNAEVVSLDGKEGVVSLMDEGKGQDWSLWATLTKQEVALVSIQQLREVHVNTRATAIEWFNMVPECDRSECPSGGGRTQVEYGLPGAYVAQETMRFERFEGLAVVTAIWPEASVVAAGEVLDIGVVGTVHLPVSSAFDCGECPPIQNQTLTLGGAIALEHIERRAEGFTAQVSGDFETARVDEHWISPAALGTVGSVAMAAAAIGVGLLVKFALVPLFTRLSKQEALDHPKRQRIFQYVQQHPGANFREVARNTEIASGTVRHHLTVLERAGHLVEHQHLGTVRLFENHGKFDQNWADVVLLREPPLALVHEWLKQHPGSPQKAVLEAMEQIGWSRSTTQHRLSRLVDGGLAAIRLQGRLKVYSIPDRPALPKSRPVGLPGSMPG